MAPSCSATSRRCRIGRSWPRPPSSTASTPQAGPRLLGTVADVEPRRRRPRCAARPLRRDDVRCRRCGRGPRTWSTCSRRSPRSTATTWSGSATPEVLRALMRYPWPGNARELRRVVRAVMVRRPTGQLTVDDLPAEVRTDAAPPGLSPHRGARAPGHPRRAAGRRREQAGRGRPPWCFPIDAVPQAERLLNLGRPPLARVPSWDTCALLAACTLLAWPRRRYVAARLPDRRAPRRLLLPVVRRHPRGVRRLADCRDDRVPVVRGRCPAPLRARRSARCPARPPGQGSPRPGAGDAGADGCRRPPAAARAPARPRPSPRPRSPARHDHRSTAMEEDP